jgi:hypothetical protein
MRELTKFDCFTYSQAAEAVGVPAWRLRYAVDSGYVPRPGVVFRRRAMYAPSQIEWLRAYFARERARSGGVDPSRTARGNDEPRGHEARGAGGNAGTD